MVHAKLVWLGYTGSERTTRRAVAQADPMAPGSAVGGQTNSPNSQVDYAERLVSARGVVCPRVDGAGLGLFVLVRRG